MKVVPLPIGNLQDIPAMLRRLAERIEKGETDAPTQLVVVRSGDEGTVSVEAFGDLPTIQICVGLLQWGIHSLIHEHAKMRTW